MSLKKYSWITGVILWSVIAAAFIGPGTITTAVKAGSHYKLSLLWAVVFSTAACIILQEMAARITIASGKNLGQAITLKFGAKNGRLLQYLTGGVVIAGCAAYEAGNILGAVSGLALMTGIAKPWLTAIISAGAFVLLWFGRSSIISYLMMGLVFIMGVGFFMMAQAQTFSTQQITQAFIPAVPAGSEMLLVALIGTTIVPYNLFLGSGITQGQTISSMRMGLIVSVGLGGVVTAMVLMAGTAVEGFSSFADLSAALRVHSGTWGAGALALGLFAAGFSSSVTAPYAAAIIGETVFGMQSKRTLRGIWLGVLLMGFVFGIMNIKPVPVILAVQSLNGFILPLLVFIMIRVVSDTRLMGPVHRPRPAYQMILWGVFSIVLVIGLNNVYKALAQTLGW